MSVTDTLRKTLTDRDAALKRLREHPAARDNIVLRELIEIVQADHDVLKALVRRVGDAPAGTAP